VGSAASISLRKPVIPILMQQEYIGKI